MSKSQEIKYISITEFREKGYLQELNRLFLHPLGLALEIQIDNNGNEKLSGIWDYRNDKEGIIYDIDNSDTDRKNSFIKKRNFVNEELQKRLQDRKNILGFDIEPIKD